MGTPRHLPRGWGVTLSCRTLDLLHHFASCAVSCCKASGWVWGCFGGLWWIMTPSYLLAASFAKEFHHQNTTNHKIIHHGNGHIKAEKFRMNIRNKNREKKPTKTAPTRIFWSGLNMPVVKVSFKSCWIPWYTFKFNLYVFGLLFFLLVAFHFL